LAVSANRQCRLWLDFLFFFAYLVLQKAPRNLSTMQKGLGIDRQWQWRLEYISAKTLKHGIFFNLFFKIGYF
jgi:hypothetical protein